MLESMGWKKGNGLGKNQQGNLDFIQVRYKNNSSGIGFDRLKDNQWTDTEHNFNALLQNLNSKSNSNSNDEDSNEAIRTKSSVKSLEEMSKQSRARVHYKKFTKGKDVFKYSEKDLANIFGKKSLNESEKVVIQQPEPEEEKPEQYESNLIINTGISITDYFKQKRKRDSVEAHQEESEKPKKKKKKENQIEIIENDDQMETKAVKVQIDSQSSEDIKSKKKKKKEKNEEQLDETSLVIEKEVKPKLKRNKSNEVVEEIASELNQEKSKSNKNKKKKNKNPSEEPQESIESEKIKMNKNEKPSEEPSEIETIEVSQSEIQTPKSNDEDRPRGANAIYSTDTIQIPSYVAQKMAKMTVDQFTSANLGNIVGYGMSEEIEIKVIQTKLGDSSLSTDKYSIYNMDKVVKTKVNPRKILSKIKRTKKSIQVI